MKKKLLFLASTLGILTMYSCASDPAITTDEETDDRNVETRAISRTISLPFDNFMADYTLEYEPADAERELMHKVVFAAAIAEWYDATFLDGDGTYNSVYQSWRVAAPYALTRAGADMPEGGASQAMLARMAAYSGSVYEQTFNTQLEILEAIKQHTGDAMTSTPDMIKMAWAIMYAQLYAETTVNQATAQANMNEVAELIDEAINYRLLNEDMFIFDDGAIYLTDEYGLAKNDRLIAELIAYCLPAVVAPGLTNAEREDFIAGIASVCNSNTALINYLGAANAPAKIEVFVKSMAAASAAAAFWQQSQDVEYFFEVSLDGYDEELINSDRFPLGTIFHENKFHINGGGEKLKLKIRTNVPEWDFSFDNLSRMSWDNNMSYEIDADGTCIYRTSFSLAMYDIFDNPDDNLIYIIFPAGHGNIMFNYRIDGEEYEWDANLRLDLYSMYMKVYTSGDIGSVAPEGGIIRLEVECKNVFSIDWWRISWNYDNYSFSAIVKEISQYPDYLNFNGFYPKDGGPVCFMDIVVSPNTSGEGRQITLFDKELWPFGILTIENCLMKFDEVTFTQASL